MTLSCAACCALCVAHNQSPEVTYTAAALPLRVALREMGAQAKVSLAVSPELENEPIILRLKDVPLKEAMERIASTVEAEWARTDGGGYRLQRSAAIVARLERERTAKRIASLEAALKRFSDEAQKHGELTPATAEELASNFTRAFVSRGDGDRWTAAEEAAVEAIKTGFPGHKICVRLLLSVPREQLAKLEHSDRIVFATHPTRMQVKLDGVEPEWFERFQREERLFASAFGIALKRQGLGDWLRREARVWDTPPEPPLKALVLCNTSGVLVKVADTTGRVVARKFFQLEFRPLEKRVAIEKLLRESQNEPGVQASPLTREISIRMRDSQSDPANLKPLSKEAFQLLANPEKHDPLSLSLSEVVLAVAEREGRQAVVHAPDSVFALAVALSKREPFRASELFLRVSEQMQIERTDGWLAGKCADPLLALRDRINRAELGGFVRHVAERGHVSIDDAARLLQVITDEQWVLPTLYSRTVTGQNTNAFEPFAVVRLYGSLTRSQRQELSKGLRLRFAELSALQRQMVSRIVLDGGLEVHNAPRHKPPTLLEDASTEYIYREPTEVLEGGIPEDTLIIVHETLSPKVSTVTNMYVLTKQADLRDLSTFAAITEQQKRLDLFPFLKGQEIEKAAIATERTVAVTIQPKPGISVLQSAHECRATGPYLSLDKFIGSLPSQLRQEFDRQALNTRKYISTLRPDDPRLIDRPVPLPPPL